MSTEATQAPLFSRQPRSVLSWLTANRLKRGTLLYWAALFTLSAAAIHFIGVLEQPPQSGFLAALLLVGAFIQAAIALSVVVVPTRRLLIATLVIEGAALLLWIVARTSGFPLESTIWQPETLGVPDLYLPAMEAVSAVFFLCLAAHTWSTAPRLWHIALAALPFLLVVGLLIWVAVNFVVAVLVVVVFILSAELAALLDLFLPAVGLIVLFLLLRVVFPRLRMMTPRVGRTALILLPALLLISLLTWEGSSTAASRVWLSTSPTVSAPARQTTTLEYCRPGGSPFAMDLAEPSAQAPRPAPLVFFIHGGDGILGDRQLEGADGVYLAQLRDELLRRGFVVGSIDYGLAPLYTITDQVEQAKCAVRFLRTHATVLGIDPQRIGVYGFSEGGYLAAMLGTAHPGAGFDIGQNLAQSSRVQAVVDIAGLTDFTNLSGSPSWFQPLGRSLTGGHTSLADRRAISPVTYVAPGDPPFLIINGTDDWQVPPHHAQELAQRLHAAGVPATLVLVQHDSHGLDAPTPGQVEQPSPAVLVQMIRDFFIRTLAA